MIEPHIQTIFLSAAEASGDAHAAKLIGRLRSVAPSVRFCGVGGAAMSAAGCDLLANVVDRSAMLAAAVGQVVFFWKLLRSIRRRFRQDPPDLVILVDSPALNFHIAKAAKSLGIPVLYYIVPQLWAWGAWRRGKLRRNTDRLACILPFEEDWFGQRQIDATYVGHPLFDDEQAISPAELEGENKDYPNVALLPGSRKHEISKLFEPMQRIAYQIRAAYPSARFVTTTSTDSNEALLRKLASAELEINIRRDNIEAVTRYADIAIVASGTATLEVAAQSCPMIVMYRVPRWQWHLVGRWLMKTKYISLINILAGGELVPEFIPFFCNVEPIAQKALELLGDEQMRYKIRAALKELMSPIMQPGATAKVAEMAKQLLPKY